MRELVNNTSQLVLLLGKRKWGEREQALEEEVGAL